MLSVVTGNSVDGKVSVDVLVGFLNDITQSQTAAIVLRKAIFKLLT